MDTDYDIEIDHHEHKKLVDNILNLNTKQHVKKPTRTEPTAHISEYNLVKSLKDKDTVRLHQLTKSLETRAVDVELRKKVKKAEVKSKTLCKPLEKPQAERIRRSAAYDNTKEQLDRWEPIVTSNRVSTNLSFPLKDPNFDYREGRDFISGWVVKSNLEKELEKLERKTEVINVETESAPKLTLKEMIEKRKELAKLRRYQSNREIKARWQNKIKSKTFRRIQRKEKIKEHMKEFELLQKTNPEKALEKLEEIEMARAEERASLRHKSTGKWARNQQIRAKYDKESRKILAEQLRVSKDLMQKQQLNESTEEDEDSEEDIRHVEDGENPWTGKIKPSKEIEDFVTGYRNYWESQNTKNSEISVKHEGTDKILNNNKVTEESENKNAEKDILDLPGAPSKDDLNIKEKKRKLKNKTLKQKRLEGSIRYESKIERQHSNLNKDVLDLPEPHSEDSLNIKEKKRKLRNKPLKQRGIQDAAKHESTDQILNNKVKKGRQSRNADKNMLDLPEALSEDSLNIKKKKRKLKNKTPKLEEIQDSSQKKRKINRKPDIEVDSLATLWEVTPLDLQNDTLIDDIFDKIEYKMEGKVKEKLRTVKSKLERNSNISNKKKKQKCKDSDKNKTRHSKQQNVAIHSNKSHSPNVEHPAANSEKFNSNTDDTNKNLELIKSVLESQPPKSNKANNTVEPVQTVKIKNLKPITLNSSLPDVLSFEDNEEDTERTGIITEAFEDTDIIEEFTQDKKDVLDKDRPKDINLTLPGWGSWGGKDIPISNTKKKRFILKTPKQFPRKDINKGNLIINESANDKIKPHLVTEVPFPFKTVKDYEASIRAPIGNTFIPETAYRKMIKPTLTTKMGSIIEPITEDFLLHKEKKQ